MRRCSARENAVNQKLFTLSLSLSHPHDKDSSVTHPRTRATLYCTEAENSSAGM